MGIAEKKKFSKSSLTRGFLITAAFWLFFFPVPVTSQTGQQLEKYPEIFRSGTIEQKRDALAELRNYESAAASRIASFALNDVSDLVAATALGAINSLPSDEAAALALPFLSHNSSFIRREAAFSLGRSGSITSSNRLGEALNRDKNKEVRAAAAFALGFTGDLNSLIPLLSVLKKKPKSSDLFLRRSAARAIGQIAERNGGFEPSRTTPESFLPESLKLAESVDPATPSFNETVRVLRQVLSNPKEANDTRREAAFALGAIGTPSSLPDLAYCSLDSDYYLAEACKEAVIKIEGGTPR